jgi:DNA replication protein DnaC
MVKRLDEILRKAYPGRNVKPSERQGVSPSSADTPTADDAAGAPEEAVCPICGGAGFVRRDVPLGHPDFGKAFPCRCAVHEREGERLVRLQRYSNLGPLTRLTFANLSSQGRSSNPRDQDRFRRCVEDARSFAEAPAGWLVLSGPSGCGKTHLAAAIANRCLELGIAALFVIVPDLLDRLRAAYHPDSDVGYDQTFDQVRNAPVLILDDLGAHSSTAWAQEKLFQIINHRFNALLPTVITTNIPLTKLDDRLYTRLSDPSLSRVYELESASGARAGHRKLDMSGQPRFRNMTFESFNTQGFHLPVAERRRLEDAYRFALDFAQKPEGWLLLTGPHDSGKTHLAAAIANYRHQQGDSPYFIKVADLLRFLREGKEMEDRLSFLKEVEEVRETPLLVLDDLDFRRGNPFWEEVCQILGHRHTARLPTVVTTSQTLANLSLDELGERLATLLGDAAVCSQIPLPGLPKQGEAATDRAEKPSEETPSRRARKRTT